MTAAADRVRSASPSTGSATALQSGNLSTAQQPYSSLVQHFQQSSQTGAVQTESTSQSSMSGVSVTISVHRDSAVPTSQDTQEPDRAVSRGIAYGQHRTDWRDI